MKIRIKLFASIRDAAGWGEQEREVDAGATVDTLWRSLCDGFERPYDPRMPILIARNQVYVVEETLLEEGDEIAFLPPLAGG